MGFGIIISRLLHYNGSERKLKNVVSGGTS